MAAPKQAEGYLKRIHVDQHVIKANKHLPDSDKKPPLTVQTSDGSLKAFTVDVLGPSKIVYQEKALSCGARCWIETTSEVVLT